MPEPRAVVALGGHAFVPPHGPLTMAAQFAFAEAAVEALVPVLERFEVVLTHGNGPQVGHMLTRVERALGQAYALPLEVCVAETEGELGYVLAQTLHNVLADRGVRRPVASLLTQVVVDGDDPAFARPTKPVGPVYGPAEAARMEAAGFAMAEDRGRGLRRVVPSPEPRAILDVEIVDALLDRGALVVAAGGGGVPVVEQPGGRLRGVDAVIDKDRVSCLLAERIGARLLLILTGVPNAYRDFGTPDASPIGAVSIGALRGLLEAGHFAPGTMGPKVEAALRFASSGPDRRAVITDPPSLAAALEGRAGTRLRGEAR
ncbi:MAG: carbamate kinase [Sandaracinaceae bacterium]